MPSPSDGWKGGKLERGVFRDPSFFLLSHVLDDKTHPSLGMAQRACDASRPIALPSMR